MKVVILCGGQGTRIRDVAENVPKPLVSIGNLPILWHIMKYYAHWGHQDFVLCLGYKGQAIKDFFINYEAHTCDFTLQLGKKSAIQYHTDHTEANWNITLADTGTNSMTGARIRKIEKYIGNDEHFLLTYGDGVCNVDLDRLIAFHKTHGRALTVTGVRPPGRFGELVSNDGSVVTEFNEKPQATGGRISGGYFVCSRKVFDYLNKADDLVFEHEPLKALVRDGQMSMFEHDEFWQCMDTYRDWQYLTSLIENGKAPWMIW